MGVVNTSLQRRAATIFRNLGYAVTETGDELQAERKWRTVHVTPMQEPESIPTSGDYRCFVTWAEQVSALETELEAIDPAYEWAIFGVDDGDEYVINRDDT
jgi:hypothetical protein